jgi:Domain of unknown function (DUF4430)
VSRIHTILVTVAAAAAAIAVAGCGLGPGPGTSNVSVTVSRDFGTRPLKTVDEPHVHGSQTIMQLLEHNFNVSTRYGGGFVESIDGRSGSGSHLDWFYYVNGIEAPLGAAETKVYKGDRIWWDLHDWSASESIPDVVGSFPEPFVHGSKGRRYPTVLECFSDVNAACDRVASELHDIGVPVAEQAPGTGSGTDSIAVIVGAWSDVRASIAGDLLEQGPSASGVYAKFAGGSLELLNPRGGVARTLGAGAGLIAATSQSSAAPTWIITGTNSAGVAAAASELTARGLDNHFAVAVSGDTEFPVPVDGSS